MYWPAFYLFIKNWTNSVLYSKFLFYDWIPSAFSAQLYALYDVYYCVPWLWLVQVVKMSRRVAGLERQNTERRQTELVLFSLLLSACLINGWLWMRRWQHYKSSRARQLQHCTYSCSSDLHGCIRSIPIMVNCSYRGLSSEWGVNVCTIHYIMCAVRSC